MMKRMMCFVLILAFCIACLSGCAGKAGTAGGGISDRDLNDDQYWLGDPECRAIAEGPDAYYFKGVNGYLYYMPKGDDQACFLCGRADCLHDRENDYDRIRDCGAYHDYILSIFYYDGCLYLAEEQMGELGMELVLNRCSLTGELEKNLMTLPGGAETMMQHRGILYYRGHDVEWTEDGSGMNVVRSNEYFGSYNLKTGEEKRLDTFPEGSGSSCGNFFAYGDYVYDRIYTEDPEGKAESCIRILNTTTGETTELRTQKGDGIIGSVVLYQGKLAFQEIYQDEEGNYIYTDIAEVYTAEPDGSNPKRLMTLEHPAWVKGAFGDMLIVSNKFGDSKTAEETPGLDENGSYAVYKQGKYVGAFELDEKEIGYIMCIADTADAVLLQTPRPESQIVAISKSDLVKGRANPKVILQIL